MSSRRLRHGFIGRVAPVTVLFQFLGVLAVPIALCCCLEMAAGPSGHDVHHSAAAGSEHTDQTEEGCPHHDSSDLARHTEDTDNGCEQLDSLVMALAGLIGVAETHDELMQSLTPIDRVAARTSELVEVLILVESPPPRA